MKEHSHPLRLTCLMLLTVTFAGCGGQKDGTGQSVAQASVGQVSNQAKAPVSYFAAARFADQVSFGANPTLIAEIQQKGFSKWIDDQFALPVSKIDSSPIRIYDTRIQSEQVRAYEYFQGANYKQFLTSQDQLRYRVNWALSQFVTVSVTKVEPYAGLTYSNFLQEHAFGNYGTFIRALTLNPPMGAYLDNFQNRPTSSECTNCAPNENYARELMQLFTIGVVKLNSDGSLVRDAQNKPLETYSQEDVSELARALTGWQMTNVPNRLDYGRYDGVLLQDSWPGAHDFGAKKILGTSLPAGRDASADLDGVVKILMSHPNIAPFVSLRLIQHLVTSDPTPAYIARVSAVFRNNGQGVAGDMKAVIKSILLDGEARAGDQMGADRKGFGKIREPVLWYTALLRGLGCNSALRWNGGGFSAPWTQNPYSASSVFSFYLPTDVAPGSNLLAPEQGLLNADELSVRIGAFSMRNATDASAAGCQLEPLGLALSESPEKFVGLISQRYFRGAMAPTLRQTLIDLAPSVWGNTPNEKAVNLLAYALSSPYFGVIR